MMQFVPYYIFECFAVVDCGSWGEVENGVVVESGTSFLLGEAHVQCQPGYFLQGAARAICQPEGSWSQSLPSCIGR